MRQAPTHAVPPPHLLPDSLLKTASPSTSVPPSVANFPAGLAHDARNVLAAMDIYCELLSGPGVLNPPYRHLIDELRLLRESSSGLMDRLLVQALKPMTQQQLDLAQAQILAIGSERMQDENQQTASTQLAGRGIRDDGEAHGRKPVASVAAELRAAHKMLSALAGPKVLVEVAAGEAPPGRLRIATVDFTRVLINLVRNAAEAMGTGGRILIAARPAPDDPSVGPAILVSVEDNGPGIPLSLLERIFDLSAATDAANEQARRRMSFRPRGLGLRIVRELVEGGGGIIRAARLPERGSRFEIVLPIVTE